MNKPAFPYKHIFNEGTARECSESSDGMSLRDYFAVRAMQAMLTNVGIIGGPSPTDEDLARYAYDAADAMLKAREES